MFIPQCFRTVEGKRRAYWALVESVRTERGPRQNVVAWLGALDEAGRLGVQEAALGQVDSRAEAGVRLSSPQLALFEFEDKPVEPQWVRVIRAPTKSAGQTRPQAAGKNSHRQNAVETKSQKTNVFSTRAKVVGEVGLAASGFSQNQLQQSHAPTSEGQSCLSGQYLANHFPMHIRQPITSTLVFIG